MAVAMIGPKFYAWDKDGNPLAFGKLYTYQARTNTPKDTYQSEDQQVANTNPVILNGEGYANVYLDGSYKVVLKDSDDNEIWSADPVTAAQASEWVNCFAATYSSATQFKIASNQVAQYTVGRRVRIDNGVTEYSYSTITSSVFAGGETTVNVADAVVGVGIVGACASIVGEESMNKSIDIDELAKDAYIAFDSTSEMIDEAKVGWYCLVDGTSYERVSTSGADITDFTNLTEIEPKNVEQDKTLELNKNYLNATNPTKSVTNSVISIRSTQFKPKLVILFGQSNAEGRGTAADANANNDTTGTRSSIQIWNNSAFEDLYIPRTSGETGNNDALPGRYGIELGMANYAEYNDETLYMVKVTEGGTYMGQWLATEDIIPVGGGDPNDPENDGDLDNAVPAGGVLDNEAWTATQAAIVAMDNLFGVNGWEPVLVMLQGEANGTSPTQNPRFKRQRLTWNDRWRARFNSTLRIVYGHILAVDAAYVSVNQYMNEIDYEDQLTYVIENTEHLQSYDNLHLNYFGLCQMSKRVYDEVRSPTSKAIAYPNGRVDTVQAASSLILENYTDTWIVEGTDSISYTQKVQCREGRILKLWRKDTGPGVTIRHDFGDPNIYANFRFVSGASTALTASTERWFRGYEGHWYEIILAP